MLTFSPNLVDAAALTPSTQDINFPASNLLNSQLARVWKTKGTQATEDLVMDLGSAMAVTGILIAAHNFDGTETLVKIQGNATNSWGGPSLTQAITVVPGATFGNVAISGTYRYWRFIFTKASAANIRQIGRIFLGLATDTVIPPDYDGVAILPVDLSTTVRSIGGQRFTEQKNKYDTLQLKQSYMPASLYTTLSAIYDAVGVAVPFFLQISTTAPLSKYYYVAFAKPFNKHVVAWDGAYVWGATLELEELL